MPAKQDPIFAEAAKTIYRVTEDERVRNHCDAREMGERTYNTLVKQLDEQTHQLAVQERELQKFRQEHRNKIQRKIAKGKSFEQIADELEENPEDIRPLYDTLVASATE